jgi:hypothetical protein
MTRITSSELDVMFPEFLLKLKKNKNLLWDIPVTYSSTTGNVAGKKYFTSKFGCSEKLINDFQQYYSEVTQLMITEGVIVPDRSAAANNMRRQLLKWWHSLSLEDKQDLDLFGNKISTRRTLKGVLPSIRVGAGYELVTETLEQLNSELLELGILKNDYILTKNRSELRDKGISINAKAKRDFWAFLTSQPLESVNDLLCVDDYDEPFIQVKQLFAAAALRVSSESGKGNYIDACTDVIKYLVLENVPPKSELIVILNEFFLTRFKQDYLQEQIFTNGLSPNTAIGCLSAARRTLNRAVEIKGLNFQSFYDVPGFDGGKRTTKNYKPYSNTERKSIDSFIKHEINLIKDLMNPYVKKNMGENPLLDNGNVRSGYATAENANYLFENHLNCKPISYNKGDCKFSKGFLKVVNNLDCGLHDLYRDWDVLPMVTKGFIAPFVLRLAQITGMNFDSIIYLDVDDFNPRHLATGKPCLTYWKERSTGGKEYHLDLFNAKLQWLTQSQSKDVEDIFTTLVSLTAEIRQQAPQEIKGRLFIYQSDGQRIFDKIMAIKEIGGYCKKMVDKYDIVDDEGERTQLNTARFRPSFVSQLLELGVSIREIQLMLGHKNICTTMGYLDRLDFNPIARKKITEALKHIHEKVVKSELSDKSEDVAIPSNDQRIIFSTPLASCANIFEPPEHIKTSKLYQKGQPCSQYNKCLSCDNVLLTKNNLPELFAMQRDYSLLIQRNRILDTPYGFVIEENLSLLDEILSLDKSDFSSEELEEGQRLSTFIETGVIDGVGA